MPDIVITGGITAQGPITLPSDPVAPLQVATKQYVDNKLGSGGGGDWASITNKPLTFTPSTHIHAISEVQNLQQKLDEKFNIFGGTINGATSIVNYLSILTSNVNNGGIKIGDNGDLADLKDGALSLRYTQGLKITTGNKGGSTATHLKANGDIDITNSAFYLKHHDSDWGAARYLHSNGGNIGFLASDGNWAAYSENNKNFRVMGEFYCGSSGNLTPSGNVFNSGWSALPNGLRFQWVQIQSSNNATTGSWPIAFTNNIIACVASLGTVGWAATNTHVGVSGTRTTYTIYRGGDVGNTNVMTIFAIGY